MVYKNPPDKYCQNNIWNTKTLSAWQNKNYDKIIFPTNIIGTETYLTIGKGENTTHIEGYEAKKKHRNDKVETVYFVRTEDIKKLPLLVYNTVKKHSNKKVYNVITSAKGMRIQPEKKMTWKEIIDYSGIPYHSNPVHWTLYKIKRLYGRINKQFYARYITESGFGKDKYPEAYRLLINAAANVSDPSRPKLFFAACHNKEITINELGVPTGNEANSYFNMCMRIGDGTQVLDNPKRATSGTSETIHVDNLSVCFTHNIPEYYKEIGRNCFEEIYPFNVVNRYYYNEYEGFCQMREFPKDKTHSQVASEYDEFIKDWIKSVLWYEEEFKKTPNKYAHIPLIDFEFSDKEERFKAHFTDFANAISHYAKDEKEYLELLHEDYDNHRYYGEKYKKILGMDKFDFSSGRLS